ncbi:riboflavin synthase subunit alpha [Ferrimonas sediminicola]|uniref:Riboflavin synthase n=1 Tax=Ferrimonas sediminicola TaxID=2569538 RepID=A0A4U1BI60_9GAMM|nr:riboflavin synthase subunit alpha [Ferrimonas sediminicola]TKB50466.1 riboflavin synthase subunit alpha [Ferrimonas sediminicola]
MFTGIVQTTATITAITERDKLRTFEVAIPAQYRDNLQVGASVAHNGVCLTVTELADDRVFFDVMEETLRVTNLGQMHAGDRVNIERSLVFGKEVGGHVVSGHVHTQARIARIERTETNCTMHLTLDPEWMKYILHKGFVAIDGCSLTVGDTEPGGFNIHLIPETLSMTTLGERRAGDSLNIEIDSQTQAIVDTVERVLAQKGLTQ